jgi:hypothetical protein
VHSIHRFYPDPLEAFRKSGVIPRLLEVSESLLRLSNRATVGIHTQIADGNQIANTNGKRGGSYGASRGIGGKNV